jgi:hypothetical protein
VLDYPKHRYFNYGLLSNMRGILNIMLLLLHATSALTSLLLTTLVYIRPTNSKLRTSFGLIATTLISGTILVISTHSPLLSSCLSGLAYTAVALGGSLAARNKLAHQKI